MSDLIRREDVLAVLCFSQETGQMVCGDLRKLLEEIKAIPSAEPERTGIMTIHEVACLLADLFDDPCACNFNGIDEWLPEKCELQNSCTHPVGVACWEQFLKYRGDR